MNDETRARSASAGQPRICVAEGIVYMAPWGYTPMGKNGLGEMLATNGSEVMVLPKVGRQVQPEPGDL